ncbi:thiamine-binding protein [uncultured Proteiniphilum sp.]|uniref:thiamine-binding protein n=1 Tax=uncultured Proteiniphilum sp. TaxID=497637 RepID=UPI00261E8F6E|nr:thiamine-binding protein [uncultured Proteiniphilum sp.]
MKTSVEISYYPINEDYKTPINKFIEALEEYEALTVNPNSMSTQVFGEYDDVVAAITKCIKDAFELPDSVFFLKILNIDREK